ncbi:hypothetical protein BLNAU_13103 [Blattamonas nauphoetae]|uniref:Uncharacterized protein n=1 Tax=Blattamonas nauphoetae TaxID=2049346 RepID=A0ABQ9XHT1_9EUKA|nr:hypothetical protein BLNAU_13103 [Blattamonas nauphoetae]
MPPKAKKQSIFDKLTDTSQYTGAHKQRFNEDGTGRGKAGRDPGVDSQTGDLSQMTRDNLNVGPTASTKPKTKTATKTTPKKAPVSPKKEEAPAPADQPPPAEHEETGEAGEAPPAAKPAEKPAEAAPKPKAKTKAKAKKTSIFDKLTDSSQYTGAHKQRFNADGTGRGKAGRDAGIDSQTADLSQMTRT